MLLFFQAVLMGLLIAAPVGPIGMLCIQRSLTKGFRSGLATGIGAASADALYGLLGALGVSSLISTMPMMSVMLKIGGGLFLIYLAYRIASDSRPSTEANVHTAKISLTRDFITTFLLTIANPMTILSFIGIFAALDPHSVSHSGSSLITVALLVSGVLVGSIIWWCSLSTATTLFKKTIPDSWLTYFSYISAIAIALFGIVQLISAVYCLAN